MKLYPHPKSRNRPDGGFTADEIKRGVWALNVDVKCTECGKEQSAAMAGSTVDGQCIRCGGRTT